jgi:hypothetical protein
VLPTLPDPDAPLPLPPPSSHRLEAFHYIQQRFHREGWGPVYLEELKAFRLRNILTHYQDRGGSDAQVAYYVAVPAAPGDLYGGNPQARSQGKLHRFGWGNKAVIANMERQDAFVTTKGFHRYYWELSQGRHKEELGLPCSDEYVYEGGSRQDCMKGYMLWKSGMGCSHVLY